MECYEENNEDNLPDGMSTSTTSKSDDAVARIEDLANSLVSAVRFSDGLRDDFQQLASCLVELEFNRKKEREELESETITASVKRHALQTLPETFQKKLGEAILAARTSNDVVMRSLQSKMTSISQEMEKTQQEQEDLQLQNERFIPEREGVSKQHDAIIAALNQKMADKAGKQIRLNETRDILRETSLGTKEYDLGMQNLIEDMKVFRSESQSQEEQLETDQESTYSAILGQKKKNSAEKRTTDKLKDKIADMGGRIDIVRKDVRRIENSKARLEIQSLQLLETIHRERIFNKEMLENVGTLEAVRDEQKAKYRDTILNLEEKMNEVEEQSIEVKEKLQALSKEKDGIFLKKEESSRKKSKAQASVRESAREVQVMKQKSTSLVERAAHLSQENTQFQEDLQVLEENHGATMDTFNQQIQEYQANLEIETTEKLKALDAQVETEKVLDDFKSEQVRFMNDMTGKIEEGRRQHKNLVKRSTEFQERIAANVKQSESLALQLDIGMKQMHMMKKELQMDNERLQVNVELYKAEIERKEVLLADKKPVLENLEAELDALSHVYSEVKNAVVAVRNREKSVQDQIKRTQVMLDRLTKPQGKLKEGIKSCHGNSLEQLREFGLLRKQQESSIYNWTQKLENVIHENEKFELSCSSKSEMVKDLCLDIKAHGYYQEFLVKELRELQRRFSSAWDICIAMEKVSAEQDSHVLGGIEELQQETKDRCVVLTEISHQLNAEMERLTGFLENVNSRRPKDTKHEVSRRNLALPPSARCPRSMAQRRRSTRHDPRLVTPLSTA